MANGAAVSHLQLLPQIGDLHLGKGPLIVAPPQREEVVHALFRLIHALNGRRGRSQDQQCPGLGTAVFRHIPRMVFGDLLRFVAPLLLLVQDDESQIAQGSKNRRAGADHHPRLPGSGPLPLVIALPRPQRAVEDRYRIPEVGGKVVQELGRQCDLRHQHQGALPPFQTLLDEPDIDLGLSAARHTVEEGSGRSPGPGQFVQPPKGGLLLLVQADRSGRLTGLGGHSAEDLPLLQPDQSSLAQGSQGLQGGARKIAQLLGRCLPDGAQQLHHRIAHRGRPPPGGDLGHGVLRRDRQDGYPLGLVPHAPGGAGL